MKASDFYDMRVKKAKGFGFPDPVYVNAEKLTEKTRVLYLVEIQAIHIPGKTNRKTHHYGLKFSKFKKIKEEPFWVEDDLVERDGFTISKKKSIEKLAAYIKANQALLDIDILSRDYTKAILTNNRVATSVIKTLLESKENRELVFDLLKESYPQLNKKILTYRLVQERKKALAVLSSALNDKDKNETNFWQPFFERNRWMFGLSYIVPVDDSRIDLWDDADYLLESEDGFVDIVEIKSPHYEFWQRDNNSSYKKYREFLQPSNELKGSIVQATNYIFQLEKRFNDTDWQRKNNSEAPVKPSCLVVFGRSDNWELEEKTAYRLLNDSLHGINIITFDYLYMRASQLLSLLEKES